MNKVGSLAGFQGLRLALVGPLPPPAGGMANQTRQLAELLRGEGAEVELVPSNAPYRPAWLGLVPVLRAFLRLLPYLLALWRAAGRAELMHVMANSGWSWHLFAAPAIWIAHLRGVPVVVNYRGGEAAGFLARSAASVGFSLRRASVLLVPSGFLQQVFARHGLRAEILPNIVDLQRFRPAGEGRPAAPPQLLVARNLEPLYDNASAIRAFARLRERFPDLRMTIAGSGPDEAALRGLAAELGLAEPAVLRFAGCQDREAMAALYRASLISLNPSLADNMPNSLLESLASGVPVVSTAVGGVPFMVTHEETALLVPPQDVAAMAAAVECLLADAGLYQGLRNRGLAEVRRYSWAEVGPQLSAWYGRCRQTAGRPDNLATPPSPR